MAAVETPDAAARPLPAQAAVARLPDLLRAAATGAGWIVPKKYVEKVGEDGFKKAPIGAGPYRFVSFTPGVELVLEAFERYWRKTPSVKRLVFKVIPDESTRLAALKRGEVDIAYSIRGELAEELRRTPGLTLKPAVSRARTGSTSPISGTRSRRGTTGACAWPPPRHRPPGASTRRSRSASRKITGSIIPHELRFLLAAARARLRSRRRPSSSSPRPAIPTASTPATTSATPPTPTSARPCSTTCRRSASAPRCGRWSGRRSSTATARRSSRT